MGRKGFVVEREDIINQGGPDTHVGQITLAKASGRKAPLR